MIFVKPLTSPSRLFWRHVATVLLLLALVAGVGLAFIWPWRTPPLPGGPLLARYVPLADGDAALVITYDADGQPLSWESQNLVFLRSGRVLTTDLREAHRQALERFYQPPDQPELSLDELLADLEADQVYEQRTRRLDADGSLSNLVSLNVRRATGDYTIAVYDPGTADDLVFEPPLRHLPDNLTPGQSWESAGRLSGQVDYRFQGRILAAGSFQGHADCLQVETRFTTSSEGQVFDDRTGLGWRCAGLGEVDGQLADALTGETTYGRLAGQLHFPADPAAQPPPGPAGPGPFELDALDEWRLQRVGRARSGWDALESTIPATWLPTDPPVVLAAAYGGDLVAFDASQPTGLALWRFHPGGAIYSQPAFDSSSGRLFFGSTDKRLYALDSRGLFLWAFETGDNVATRPLVLSDTVIFGSEDRIIYALDQATGSERWRISTDGAIVSSPALAAGVVIIGSDDGTLYGLDPDSGEERWSYPAGDALEAPIAVAEEAVYAAGREGQLYALDAASGEALWTADLDQTLRTAPAVSDEAVFVVDEGGYLNAFNRETGRRLWTSAEYDYVGSPALVDDSLLVAGTDGQVYQVGRDGVRQSQAWNIGTDVRFGPVLGSGAAWLADTKGVVWRLGPPVTGGPVPLTLAWSASAGSPPFSDHLFYSAPVEQGGQALVIDDARRIYRLDPATGQASPAGQFGQEGVVRFDPVVAGDRILLAPVVDRLFAVDLADSRTLWEFQGEGMGTRPVTVAGQTVLWLVKTGDVTQPGPGRLYALELADGRLRWQAELSSSLSQAGEAVVDGSTVYISTPPAAFELATGQQVWQAQPAGQSLGGPALDEAGDTLFVGTLDPAGERGAIIALNTANGELRWQAELAANTALHPLEKLWISGDVLVAPTFGQSGSVLGLDAATGAERWQYLPAPAPRFGAVTVAAGRVWLALEEGQVVGLDARTGREVARYNDILQNLNEYNFAQRPAVVGDHLLVPLSLSVLAFELPGE